MARRFDDDPDLVLAARFGDEQAFTTLFRRWFAPCVDVARRIVRDDDTAAEVAQETFLVAWRQLGTLRDPSAFGGWVLRTSRNKALNRLERERRSIAVDQDESPVLAELEAGGDVAADVAARDQQQLVWAAAAALGERDASILDLHLRHELDAGEIAEALGVTPNNAHQLLFRMKGRLASGIRAWVLFKGGDPACPELAADLRRSDALRFSAATVKVVGRHVQRCDDCADRQAAVLAPEALFASVPLLPIGVGLREQVAEGLRQAGVPLGPDAAVPVEPAATEGAGAPDADLSVDGDHGPGEGHPGPVAEAPAPDPDSTTALASPATVGVEPSVGVGDPPSGEPRSSRAAIAVVALLLVLAGGVLWALRSGGDDEVEVVAASEPGSTSTASQPSSTAPPAREPELVIEFDPTTDVSTPEAPVAPVPTDAPRVPPSPAPPGPVPPTPDTTAPPAPPPPPPPPPPVVDGFVATPTAPPGSCAPGQFPFAVSWATTGATAVTVTSPDAVGPVAGGPDGTATACALTPSGTWTLTATGPGGSAVATAP